MPSPARSTTKSRLYIPCIERLFQMLYGYRKRAQLLLQTAENGSSLVTFEVANPAGSLFQPMSPNRVGMKAS